MLLSSAYSEERKDLKNGEAGGGFGEVSSPLPRMNGCYFLRVLACRNSAAGHERDSGFAVVVLVLRWPAIWRGHLVVVRDLRCGKMPRLLTGITDLTVTRTRLTKITCVQHFPSVQFRRFCSGYYASIICLLLHASLFAIYINSICHGTCKKMLGALSPVCWTRRPRTSSTAKRYLCSSSTSFTATTMLLLASFRIGKPSTASTLTALFSSTGLASMNSRRSRDSWWMKMFSI